MELQDGSTWHPWNGPINQPYRFKYVKSREYQLHGAASALLIHQLLPRTALDWLSRFTELWAQLIYLFAGQYEHAGILGEIVVKADQASVHRSWGVIRIERWLHRSSRCSGSWQTACAS
ncbi:hypothetical protein BH77_11575 [Pseudomonas aeruginosa C2773C]|nr:hypothetical protein BH77_11575 [Pseudomonas aeruginosa C2773C]